MSMQPDGGQNVRLIRVVLDDCPIGVWFEQALQGTIIDCTAVKSAKKLLSKLRSDNDSSKKVTRADVSLTRAVILHSLGQIEQAKDGLRSLIATEEDVPDDTRKAAQFQSIITKAKEYLDDPSATWDFFRYGAV